MPKPKITMARLKALDRHIRTGNQLPPVLQSRRAKLGRPFCPPDLRPFGVTGSGVRERVPVSICAYCVMPDHLHAIPFVREGTTISDVMMRFKISASRRISSPWQKSCRSEKWGLPPIRSPS